MTQELMAPTLGAKASNKRLIFENLITLLGTVAAQVATLAATIIVARGSRPSGYAALASALAATALAVDLSDFGITTYLTREVAKGTLSLARAHGLLICRIQLTAMLALFISPVVILFRGHRQLVVAVLFYCVTQSFSASCVGLLRSQYRFTSAAVCAFVERLALLLTILAATILDSSLPTAYVVGGITGNVLVIIISRGCLGRRELVRGAKLAVVWNLYVQSRHLGLSGLFSDLSTLEAPLVSAVAGAYPGGRFAAANRLSSPLGLPAAVMGSVFIARFSSMSDVEARKMTRRLQGLLLVGLGVPFAALCVASASIVRIGLGSQYGHTTAVALRFVVIATLLGSMNAICSTFLQARGHQRKSSYIVAYSMVVGLVATGVGAMLAGAIGASVGVLVKEIVAFLSLNYYFHILGARHPTSRPDTTSL